MNEFTSVNMESKVAGLIKENNEYISKLKAVIDEKSSLEVELEKLLVQLDLRRNDQQALQIENEGLRRSIKEERMKTAQEERDYRLVEDKLEKMEKERNHLKTEVERYNYDMSEKRAQLAQKLEELRRDQGAM